MTRLWILILTALLFSFTVPFAPARHHHEEEDERERHEIEHDDDGDEESDDDSDEDSDEDSSDDEEFSDDKVLEFLERIPSARKELKILQRENEEEYRDRLEDWGHTMLEYRELREEEPEEAAAWLKHLVLESDLDAAARVLQKTRDPEARARKKTALKQKLGEVFDARMAEQEKELEMLVKEATELKRLISKRKQHREKIIDRRLQQLTEDEELEWW